MIPILAAETQGDLEKLMNDVCELLITNFPAPIQLAVPMMLTPQLLSDDSHTHSIVSLTCTY